MSFTTSAFAIAGLIAAAGPVVIHLLNRRRYRTVDWGAMAFLRKAVHKSRRSVRLRDLILLALRTAAILLFGLALARPVVTRDGLGAMQLSLLAAAALAAFAGAIGAATARAKRRRFGWAALSLAGVIGLTALLVGPDRGLTAAQTSSRHPVHAILVIDNSRSMATRTLAGTLLDSAKTKAAAVLDDLPPGSRVSVLPLCGPERTYTLDPHRHADDARPAIARIDVTDRPGSALHMLALATEAAKRVPELPAKRVLFLGDQQATGWPRQSLAVQVKTLGAPLYVAQVTPASGGRQPSEPPNIWVQSFTIQDGLAESDSPATFLARIAAAGDVTINNVEAILTSAGETLASQTFDLRPGQTRELSLTAPLTSSAPAGDATFVPVTLSIRVPDPAANRLERDDARHLAVPLVTSLPVVFVDQFGPDESLDAGRVGETYRLRRLLAPRPAEGVYEPFVAVRHVTIDSLDEETLRDARLVVIAGVEGPSEEAVNLLRAYVETGHPLLIAAGANFDPAEWTAAAWRDGAGILPAPLAETPVGVRPSQATANSRIQPFRLDSASLKHPFFEIEGEPAEAVAGLWRQPFFFQAVAADLSGTQPDDSAAPRVLARFARPGPDGENLPYLIEHRIGRGRVIFMTAGLSSDWDTLTQTNAIVLLDRITRSLLEGTLPRRAFDVGAPISLPIERRPDVTYAFTPPAGEPLPADVEPTSNGYAVRLDETSLAGHYTVTGTRQGDPQPVETIPFAVNATTSESDLAPLDAERLATLAGEADVTWLGPNDPISLTGGAGAAGRAWQWLAAAVLACLLAEMAVASRTRRKDELVPTLPRGNPLHSVPPGLSARVAGSKPAGRDPERATPNGGTFQTASSSRGHGHSPLGPATHAGSPPRAEKAAP